MGLVMNPHWPLTACRKLYATSENRSGLLGAHAACHLRDGGLQDGARPVELLLLLLRVGMVTMLHRATHHYRNPSLLSLSEYRELEKQPDRAACSREGNLLEYETLELRVSPPEVIIQQSEDEPTTHVAISSANRAETLTYVRARVTTAAQCCRRWWWAIFSSCNYDTLHEQWQRTAHRPSLVRRWILRPCCWSAGGAALHRAGLGRSKSEDQL